MRMVLAALLFTLLYATPAAAQTPVDPAAVVTACALQTNQRIGRSPDDPAIRTYCQCAIDRSAEVFTPAEFDIMGRYGLSQSQMGPPPTDEEFRSVETPEFAARVEVFNGRLQVECVPFVTPTTPN